MSNQRHSRKCKHKAVRQVVGGGYSIAEVTLRDGESRQ